MKVLFNKPPFIEAICQFQFAPAADKPLDSTVPGLIYNLIRNDFPVVEEQPGIHLQFAMGTPSQPQVSPVTNRVFFKRTDGTAIVQVGPNFLAVNCLPPYPNWDAFQATILDVLRIYQEIAQPVALFGVELRYINHINLPSTESGLSVNIADYVTAYPNVPTSLLRPQGLRFVQRVEIRMPESQGILVIQSATVEAVQEDQSGVLQGGIIMDLSFTFSDENLLPLAKASDWIDAAHNKVEQAFLACITEKARESFEEEHYV